MSRFAITVTPLQGLLRVGRQLKADERGSLSRLFCMQELAQVGWQQPIAQINHTRTLLRGTLRGMHFQRPPHAEMKLVSCLQGEVWDVAVDLRVGSPTYLQWHGEHLSADNRQALLIPEGFAHGFQALSDQVELLYCHSQPYVAESDAGLNPLDPRLAIAWPLPVVALSAKDGGRAMVGPEFEGVRL